MTEIYIPEEIWRQILSYLTIPYTSSVCSFLHKLEKDVDKWRYGVYTHLYVCIDDALFDNWDIGIFLLHHKYDIDDGYFISRQLGEYGSRSTIRDYLRRDDSHIDIVSRGATCKGRKDIVEYLIDRGANNFHEMAYYAGVNGHTELRNWILNREAR